MDTETRIVVEDEEDEEENPIKIAEEAKKKAKAIQSRNVCKVETQSWKI